MLKRIVAEFLRWRRPPPAGPLPEARPSPGLLDGEALLARGDAAGAAASYRRALLVDPSLADAWYGLGSACQRGGDPRRAHLYYRTALGIRPRDANVLNELGLVELDFGNPAEAEAAFESAVNCDPAHAKAWNNLGLAVAARGDLRQARRCFRRAVSLKPDFYTALCNLGLALRQAELFDEAHEILQRAAALRPASAEAWLNLGAVLQDEGRLDDSLAALQTAREVAPHDPAALTALGDLHLKRGEPEAAERWLGMALEASPEDAEARLGLAHLRLAQGDFERGWPLYEARLASRSSTLRRFPVPAWDGSSLAGRSVLVYGEQGLGDEIMFASMLPDLVREAAACRLVCHPRLRTLFARSFPGVEMLTDADASRLPPDGAHFCLALGSLGGRYRPRCEAFPRHQGYLRPDRSRIDAWRRRFRETGAGPWIGIAWRGGLSRTGAALRSLAPESLGPLLRALPAAWVSLQHWAEAGEIGRLEAAATAPVQRWDEALSDFDEMAALMGALDLVISVCSTTAHLSGALGRPTWILTPFAPAWRYQLSGASSPWYPSARLFRQPAPGAWAAVVADASLALRERVQAIAP